MIKIFPQYSNSNKTKCQINFGSGAIKGIKEETFLMIKPGFNKYRQEVLRSIRNEGLDILTIEVKKLPRKVAEKQYSEHAHKPFFKEYVDYIVQGPVVLIHAKGIDAIDKGRIIVDKMRKKYLLKEEKRKNLLHAADVPKEAKTPQQISENAQREINLHKSR